MRKTQNDLGHPMAWRQADVRTKNQWPGSPRDIDGMRRRPLPIRQEKFAAPGDRFERRADEMREVRSNGTADDRKGCLGRLVCVRVYGTGFDGEAERG